MINLELKEDANPNIGNTRVRSYDLGVFKSNRCITRSKDLIEVYDAGIKATRKNMFKQPRAITMDDNYSRDILMDIIGDLP